MDSELGEENQIEYSVPNDLRKLRACFSCHLIKTEKQFADEGCSNCLYFKQNRYPVYEYTSGNFEGTISVIDNQVSWISRHLNLTEFIPGVYALRIRSKIPESLQEALKANGIPMAKNSN